MSDIVEIKQHISIKKYEGNEWKSVFSTGDMETSIYPASVSKIFVGAEVLRQVDTGNISLEQVIIIKDNNVANFKESEFPYSTLPILKAGNAINVDQLLFLMLSRSDDTAANELIDLVTRESINVHTVQSLGMNGSEITRKYCSREKEDEKYKQAAITMVIPRHVELFFQKLYTNEIHSKFVSEKLKEYMNKLTGTEQLSFLDKKYLCTYKGGHHASKMRDGRSCVWRHYVMLIDIKGSMYSIVFFSISKSYEDVLREIEGRFKQVFFNLF